MAFLHTRQKGDIGEDIACKYLISKGFQIESRNFLKPWGEIDIIAVKDRIVHFVEVKSVTVADISSSAAQHRPEDNVHGLKVRHIRRMVQIYLEQSGRGLEADFRFHVVCVFMDMRNRMARIRFLEDMIL